MEFTGERYVSNLDWPELSYEHWHRYLYALPFVAHRAVLDIACGEGYGSDLLAKQAERVVGIDASHETIVFAQAKYIRSNLEFHVGLAEAIPIDNPGIFDVIVSFETIEHLQVPVQEQFIREVKRLLKPGGIFIISTPNKQVYSDETSFQNQYHYREFYVDEFSEWLGGFFRVIHLLGQKVYPVSYLWNLNTATQLFAEYQLDFANRRFEPLSADHKQAQYVIAVCSDEPFDAPGNSVLIDLTAQAIYQRVEQMLQAKNNLEFLSAQIEELNLQLDAIYTSKWWRLASVYRAAIARCQAILRRNISAKAN